MLNIIIFFIVLPLAIYFNKKEREEREEDF